MSSRKVPASEIAQHNSPDDIWIVVDGRVYDITAFAPSHPGGSDIIHRYAGTDASNEYNQVHGPSLIQKTLEPDSLIGLLDESTIEQGDKPEHPTNHNAYQKPPLHQIINLHDFEDVAQQTLSPKSWAFIHGAANDNLTRDANQALLRQIWLRPAIMRDVSTVSTATTLFGCHLSMPIYIAPTGAARMAGNEGELGLAQAAGTTGVIQCIATPSSVPHREILDATREHAFFQLYVNKDREESAAAIRNLVNIPGKRIGAIFVTADLPVVSKREADERVKMEQGTVLAGSATVSGAGDRKGAGLARQASSMIDSRLSWEDLRWLRSITDVPIVIKGIQRAKDARIALRLGCDGIVVSNHGGRAADTAQPAILTLLELRQNCPEVFQQMKVLVDGGFRRGSDVVKAICLGASVVGFGRPLLYSLSYGKDGVEHALEIIRDEVETAMRLCGMTDLMRDAHPQYINTRQIDPLVMPGEHSCAGGPGKRLEKL